MTRPKTTEAEGGKGGASGKPAPERPHWSRQLTLRQWRFVEEYLVDLNGAAAARRAGYSAATARQMAYENLRKRNVADAVDRALSIKAGVTRTRIIEELAAIGFANLHDYLRPNGEGDPYADFSALTREQAAALAEVTVEDFKDGRGADAREVRRIKFKLHDKLAALDRLGKATRLLVDRHEHSGADGGPVEVIISGKDAGLL